MVGILSFSITRLKHPLPYTLNQVDSRRWNHKFLDYEIETLLTQSFNSERLFSWNHKFLDYEIETVRNWVYEPQMQRRKLES